MNKNLIITMFVSAMVSAIVTTVIVLSVVGNFSNNEVSGKGGYFSLAQPQTATLTGYEWLQLNNKSDNKIHLSNGKVFVTSPSFIWNGETVATREWVEEFCK